MSDWQFMDSAPRDETRFLFCNSTGFVGIGRYIHKTAFAADSWGGLNDTIPVLWQPLPSVPEMR